MCRWMGSHFRDWIDYNGVTFSADFATELLLFCPPSIDTESVNT